MFFIPTKPCAPASPCCCVYLAISLFMTTEHTLGTSQARRRDAQLAARVRVKDASKSPWNTVPGMKYWWNGIARSAEGRPVVRQSA